MIRDIKQIYKLKVRPYTNTDITVTLVTQSASVFGFGQTDSYKQTSTQVLHVVSKKFPSCHVTASRSSVAGFRHRKEARLTCKYWSVMLVTSEQSD